MPSPALLSVAGRQHRAVRGSASEDDQSSPHSDARSHFIEHVNDLSGLMIQAARVLRPGGEFRATAPHFSNPYFYSDPTHRRFFGLYTFCYLADGSPFRRQVPIYSTPLDLRLETVEKLRFKASHPFTVVMQ